MTTGQQLFDLANKHVGEKYVLGVLVPKNNPNWKGPWDCAELLSWAVFQLTQGLFGCTNDSNDPRTADAYSGAWGDDGDRYKTKIPVGEAAVTISSNPAVPHDAGWSVTTASIPASCTSDWK